jgi:hypothetical protein
MFGRRSTHLAPIAPVISFEVYLNMVYRDGFKPVDIPAEIATSATLERRQKEIAAALDCRNDLGSLRARYVAEPVRFQLAIATATTAPRLAAGAAQKWNTHNAQKKRHERWSSDDGDGNSSGDGSGPRPDIFADPVGHKLIATSEVDAAESSVLVRLGNVHDPDAFVVLPATTFMQLVTSKVITKEELAAEMEDERQARLIRVTKTGSGLVEDLDKLSVLERCGLGKRNPEQ